MLVVREAQEEIQIQQVDLVHPAEALEMQDTAHTQVDLELLVKEITAEVVVAVVQELAAEAALEVLVITIQMELEDLVLQVQ
jgi:hypothetical protein